MPIIQTVGGGPTNVPPQHTGPRGAKGWNPIMTMVNDGAYRKVMHLDYVGGVAPKPATGYMGPNGTLVATAAQAQDLSALKITNFTQQPNNDLLVTFHDGSTYTIVNFFADMATKAADVVARHTDILAKHVDILAKYAEIEQKRIEVNNGSTNAAASAAIANALVTGVATARPSIKPSFLLDFANARMLPPGYTFSRNSPATYRDLLGIRKIAAANVPRLHFDPATGRCLGFYGESLSSNQIRNNSMAGAVVGVIGNGGVWPLYWSSAPDPALTIEITELGTTNGDATMGVRISGVATQNTALSLLYDSATQIAATTNQTWTVTAGVALIGGSIANIPQIRNGLRNGNSTGNTIILSQTGQDFKGNLTGSLTRFSDTFTTVNDANLAFVRPILNITSTIGQPIDITLRISLPQIEQGTDASSPIVTTNGAITRATDNLTYPITSDWYNSQEGTLYVEFLRQNLLAGAEFAVLRLDNNNIIRVVGGAATLGQIRVDVISGGVTQTSLALTNGSITNTWYRVAVSWKAGAFAASLNGAAVVTSSSGIVPQGLTELRFSGGNAFRSRVAYYPKALPNTEVQGLTATGLLAGKDANQLPANTDLADIAWLQSNQLKRLKLRQEHTVEGTGASRTVNIRRNYDFDFEIVDSTGSTIGGTAVPLKCLANTNYPLTFNAPAGTILTYSITPESV